MNTNILAIPEIHENIFSYITEYSDFEKLLRVNRIWQIEVVQAILKLYKDMFYRYNHIFLNIILIDEFNCLQDAINKSVYIKIYWPINRITYIDYREKLKNIQSDIDYTIAILGSIDNELLPLNISKKIDYLHGNYTILSDKIGDTLYNDDNDIFR